MTSLSIASGLGLYEMAEFLLQRGAKVIKKDKYKRSSLIIALRNGHCEIAKLLIYNGCPVDEPDSSDNFPIHYACAYGSLDAIPTLIKAGANPNSLSAWKLTPISVAMMQN